MELRNIESFLKVAELSNFSKAARQLGYSQPTVTVQISQLEEELGVKLFDRVNRRVRLTDAGVLFMEYAARLMDTVEEAKTALHQDKDIRGTLRIGVAESLSTNILPQAITMFQKRCPGVEVSIRTPPPEVMFKDFRKNELDVIYFLGKLKYESDWVKVIERPEKVSFTVAPEHPLANQQHVPLARVLEEPLIITEKSTSYCYELSRELAKKGYELHPMLEAGNPDLLIHLLQENGGVAFLPEYAADDEVKEGTLAYFGCDEVKVEVYSQLAYNKKKWLTPQLRIFLEIMEEIEGDPSTW